MKAFVGILVMIGVALGGVFLFAPDRVKDQASAALAFVGSSFGRLVEAAADKLVEAKTFVVEQSGRAKEKTLAIIDPQSPQEKRADILNKLEGTLAQIENPRIPPAEKQKLAAAARELIGEAKEANENEPGLIGSLVGALAGPKGGQCNNSNP